MITFFLRKNFFSQFINYTQQAKTLWIAYSGGLDSSVLLHLFAKCREQISAQVCAVHIHHGLNPLADEWQRHCEAVCAQLSIPLQTYYVNARAQPGESPEAAARNARYRVFQTLVQTNEILVTAHHQDDQAETLLLQLLRGAGVKGLAAMPESSPFAAGRLVRPLLALSRAELLAYAEQQGIAWVEDNSNADLHFDRNYLRHRVMPVVRQRWPAADAVIARAAQHCADAAAIMAEVAAGDLLTVQGEAANRLSIPQLLTLSASRQRHVLRFWFERLGLAAPSAQHLEQLFHSVIEAAADANPQLQWQNVTVRRYRDHLYALNEQPESCMQDIEWDCRQPLALPGLLGTLHCEFKQGQGIAQQWLNKPVSVRFRRGGERCQPHGRQGSHPLKKCFQEWGVPPWQRDTIPLIYQGERLMAVVGCCVCAPFAATAAEIGGIISHSRGELLA